MEIDLQALVEELGIKLKPPDLDQIFHYQLTCQHFCTNDLRVARPGEPGLVSWVEARYSRPWEVSRASRWDEHRTADLEHTLPSGHEGRLKEERISFGMFWE